MNGGPAALDKGKEELSPNRKRIHVQVTGMSCASCVAKIERHLKQQSGEYCCTYINSLGRRHAVYTGLTPALRSSNVYIHCMQNNVGESSYNNTRLSVAIAICVSVP